MDRSTDNQSARTLLAEIKAPWVSGFVGMSIIVVAFLISIVNASVDTPNKFVTMTLQPFIFVGLGLLLFHVGQHVHAMNQNVIRMSSGMDTAPSGGPDED